MSATKASEQTIQPEDISSEKTVVNGGTGVMKESKANQESALMEEPSQGQAQSQPAGLKLTFIIFGLCLSVFCVALDTTIISTAIPRITDDFHALQDVGWYGSAYLLTTCAFQLFMGKLYFLFDIKMVFLAAVFVFELGSLICGVAPNSPALIVGRAIAGVGAAGIFSGALIIIANITPLEKRPVYQGALGGIGVTAAMITVFLRLTPNGSFKNMGFMKSLMQLDPVGTVLFIPSIICLLLALQWGGTTYAWSDGRIIALFIIFGITLIGFAIVQYWMNESATVPLRIGLQRTVASSSLFIFCLGGAFFLFIYFLPIWFQAVLGVNALQSGIDTIALILSNTFGIFFSGGLTTAFGYYMPYVYLSVIFTSIGSGLLMTLNPTSSTGRWVGYQILYGFGCGCAFQLPQIAAQTVLAPQDIPIGVAITLLFTMLGGSVFVSAANNVLNNSLVQNLAALNITNIDPEAVVTAGATRFRSLIPAQFISPAIDAYNEAVTKTFQVALILSCLSVLGAAGMEWKSVKAGQQSPPTDKTDTGNEKESV